VDDAERDLLAELLGHVHDRHRRPRAPAPPQPRPHHVVHRLPALGHRLAQLARHDGPPVPRIAGRRRAQTGARERARPLPHPGAERAVTAVRATATIVAGGLAFPECPRWHAGRYWLADMHVATVLSYSPNAWDEPRVEVALEQTERDA